MDPALTGGAGGSLWFDTLAEPVRPRPRLTGDHDVDICVVGAGFTGLWTAYHLLKRDPGLRVAVLEAEYAGFGASGRNGGWCSALFPAPWSRVAREYGAAAAAALAAALRDTVDEVGRFCAAEGVAADYHKGGTLVLARSAAQEDRLRAEVAAERHWDPDARWLSPGEVAERVVATRVRGAAYTPHCAVVHPATLVRGLAERVVARGAELYERTPATRLGPGRVETPHGTVRARVVVRATEGFTARLPAHRRTLLPVYSLMIATAPLPDPVWAQLGWRGRETLSDGRHLLIYAQRTADGRVALGGRGAPYHLGSRVHPAYDHVPRVFAALRATLVDLFPALAETTITHRWGGPLGVPRDWFPSVGFDRDRGLAWAGGYVGDGVAATNLAGRTLADLVLGRDTALTRLPWVNRRPRAWEPEPVRWLGVNGVRRVMGWADRAESRTGRPARLAELADRLVGR